MAKITRKQAKIFGSNAGVDQRSIIGSLFAGSPAFSIDPDDIQSLSNYLDGWESIVIGGNSPAIEDMNALHFLYAYQLAYLMQTGLPEWNTDTVYYIGSLVNNGTGKIYSSLTDDNQGNAVTDTVNWKLIAGNILTTLGDLMYAGADGNLARLAGATAANKYFLTQTGTGAGSAAPSWQQQKATTFTKLLSTGTTAGYVFTITSGAATVGATYTNNGNTYTVLATIAASTTLFCSQSAAPQTSGTLTKTSGSGDATITFSLAKALAVYTTPTGPSPLYLKVRMVGGGGGGGGGGQTGTGTPGSAGAAGTPTRFGEALLALCNGGNGGGGGNTTSNGVAGGSASIGSASGGFAVTGGSGTSAFTSNSATVFGSGGAGGTNPFGGSGYGTLSTNAGGAGVANTGAGGGGGGAATTLQCGGGVGGGAGGYSEFIITTPAASYYYAVGTGGALGAAGSNGANGGAGGSGVIIIEEYYQ